MRLRELEVRHLRVIEAASLIPAGGINVIVGANGSGKSSLLEAIHLLGTGRSFRSRGAEPLIRYGEKTILVHARVRGTSGEDFSVGVEKTGGSTRIRLAEREVRNAATLARRLPVVLIPPDSQRILSDGAHLRRRLVDWGLFHVEPSYARAYQGYRRALQQRNAQLRESTSRSAMVPWDRELEDFGEDLHRLRQRHLHQILPTVAEFMTELLALEVSIYYQCGWSSATSFGQALRDNVARDRVRGHTTVGPHRADLQFTANGEPAQLRLSRGEAKLFCLAVWLAQARDFHARTGRMPIILIDDLAAELDVSSRLRVHRAVANLGAQTFVTAVSKTALAEHFPAQKSFHVERGEVVEMV